MSDIDKHIGDICPHCKRDSLELVEENEPYTIEHLQCPVCDSTYPIAKLEEFVLSMWKGKAEYAEQKVRELEGKLKQESNYIERVYKDAYVDGWADGFDNQSENPELAWLESIHYREQIEDPKGDR